jgi:hypothetical protein
MSEDGVGCGDPAVTGEREIKTSAHAVAFDRGDDRHGIAGDCVHERLSHARELVGFRTGQCGDFVQVGADREKLAIARNDQWAELFFQLVFQFAEGNAQREHAGARKAVGTVVRREPQDVCRTAEFDSEEKRRHGNILSETKPLTRPAASHARG